MSESVVCERVREKCQITHPTKQVYSIWLADYLCDIILEVSGCYFPSARKVLTSSCSNFKSIEKDLFTSYSLFLVQIYFFKFFCMFDEANGWTETSKTLKKHEGIPIVKLEMDFPPDEFNECHQSLFTDKMKLTVKNCVKIYEICDYHNDTKMLSLIEAFMVSKMILFDFDSESFEIDKLTNKIQIFGILRIHKVPYR